MRYVLIALFFGVPLAEIAIFIFVGERIGLWPTIGMTLLTATAGGTLLRVQGLTMLVRARHAMRAERIPVAEVLEGAGLVLAAILLLAPGFLTDSIGLLLFFPPLRRLLLGLASHRFSVNGQFQGDRNGPPSSSGPIIDGEYHEVRPENDTTPKLPKGPTL